jgi:glyoxylase-like metal-dependent hydrolase (beta-lactamase superfamily II)
MIEYKQIIQGLNIRPKIGFFGYSSVTFIKDGGENILVDTGSYGIREYLANFAKQVNIHKIFYYQIVYILLTTSDTSYILAFYSKNTDHG